MNIHLSFGDRQLSNIVISHSFAFSKNFLIPFLIRAATLSSRDFLLQLLYWMLQVYLMFCLTSKINRSVSEHIQKGASGRVRVRLAGLNLWACQV